MSFYLVTGGAGFIGSHLVTHLLEQGHRVRVLDNLSTGNLKNLGACQSDIEFVNGDIQDETIVKESVKNIDVVLHEAALISVSLSVQDPVQTEMVNVVGTLRLMQAARDAGVRRFVYASSAAVYGSSPDLPKRENMTPCPSSPYGFSKLATEHYGRLYTELHGMETVGLRYFNVLGPRQNPSSEYSGVIAKFIAIMLAGKAPMIFGDGLQTRDYVYVGNIVQANMLAASSHLPFGVYNVATGVSYTLLEVVQALNTLLGTHLTPSFAPARPGDIRLSQADITAICKYGYAPQIDFNSGLAKTVAWYRDQLA